MNDLCHHIVFAATGALLAYGWNGPDWQRVAWFAGVGMVVLHVMEVANGFAMHAKRKEFEETQRKIREGIVD